MSKKKKPTEPTPPRIIVFTGAGLSASSGLKTFRGENGLWEGHKIDRVCNYLTWKRNRDAVIGFYNERRAQLDTVQPNDAHRAISQWQERWGERVIVLTQNVDDLLERAGCRDVVHLHGRLWQMKCEACGHVWDIGYRAFGLEETCPRCPCRNGVKPNVVFFEERAPEYRTLWKTWEAITPEDVIVVIGTSGTVLNIGQMCYWKTCRKVLNNLEASEAINDRDFHHVFYRSAPDTAPEITAILEGHMAGTLPSVHPEN